MVATWQRRLGWWLLFVLVLEAALYTYLFSAFVVPAAALTLLALAIAGRNDPHAWRRFGEGVLALAVVTLLFLPLANNAWGVSSAEGTPGRAFADFLVQHPPRTQDLHHLAHGLARSAALVSGRPGAGGPCAAPQTRGWSRRATARVRPYALNPFWEIRDRACSMTASGC